MKRTSFGTWVFIEILFIYAAINESPYYGILAVVNIVLVVVSRAIGLFDIFDFIEDNSRGEAKIKTTLSYYLRELQDPYSERNYYKNMEDLCLMLYANNCESINDRLLKTILNNTGEYYSLASARTLLKTYVAQKLSETDMGNTLSEKDRKRLLHTQNIIVTMNDAHEKSSVHKYYR